MIYRDKVYDLIEEINSLDGANFKFEGIFKIRVRNYDNIRYPDELEISLMFIRTKLPEIPIEVIKHTFIKTRNNEDDYYRIFYKELLNFIIFCRSDLNNTYIDMRGEKVIIRSIRDWLTKNKTQ